MIAPYGKLIKERTAFNNLPMYAVVTVGLNAWKRAKHWNKSPADAVAMVLPPDTRPEALTWPVDALPTVIDADVGPSFDLISALALTLLRCGSVAVTLVSFTGSHEFTRFVWCQPC